MKILCTGTASAKDRDLKCNFCDNVFKSKDLLMTHRKETHSEANSLKCRDFQKGTCRYKDNECWYNHNEEQVEQQKNVHTQDFQKVQNNPHPPDMMERMRNMMEMLTEKVKNLKKIVKIDQ
jgi:hypothetical protein